MMIYEFSAETNDKSSKKDKGRADRIRKPYTTAYTFCKLHRFWVRP